MTVRNQLICPLLVAAALLAGTTSATVARERAVVNYAPAQPLATQRPARLGAPKVWVLVAPPDDPTVMALLDNLERLPGRDDQLGHRVVRNLPLERARSLQRLFERTKSLPSATERVRFLVQRAVLAAQPVEEWRRVRRFSSQTRCESILEQLRAQTAKMTREIGFRPGMWMDELQWPVMAESYTHGRCVYEPS